MESIITPYLVSSINWNMHSIQDMDFSMLTPGGTYNSVSASISMVLSLTWTCIMYPGLPFPLVTPDWHNHFDRAKWCLVPESKWVDKLYKSNSEMEEWPIYENFPEIEVITYSQ